MHISEPPDGLLESFRGAFEPPDGLLEPFRSSLAALGDQDYKNTQNYYEKHSIFSCLFIPKWLPTSNQIINAAFTLIFNNFRHQFSSK